jgi:hypothetical protein
MLIWYIKIMFRNFGDGRDGDRSGLCADDLKD